MNTILDLEKLSHRSKSRIKDLGEVFTPESYVEDMLDLLAKNKKGIWSDEEIIFFEPCAGHGNIVLPIYKRRLEAIYKKALQQGIREAACYAVANTINTLWAIDIDRKNVENCRTRVLAATMEFLKAKLAVRCDFVLISKRQDFFAHFMAALKWHIHENETLSALTEPNNAKATAGLTKAGSKWFSQNGHHRLDFDLSWAAFFESCEPSKTIPLEFERSTRFIETLLSGKNRGFEDFDFAKSVIDITKTTDQVRKPSRSVSVGA
jgi:hypothetical protein